MKAGHLEILGETIAKFKFFENGYNPYSRYLDVDKVDLILRKRTGKVIKYIEVQVKYGRLYQCQPKWQLDKFDYTSWRTFNPDEFAEADDNLLIACILAHPTSSYSEGGYKGDIFIFKTQEWLEIMRSAIKINTKKGKRVSVYFAHSFKDDRWYLWKKFGFLAINLEATLDITNFRRRFDF